MPPFPRFCPLADIRAQLSWKAVWNLTRMGIKGHGRVVRRVYGAVREMRDADAYLKYPGSTRKPDFVPPGFGSIGWVDDSRSDLSLSVAAKAGG